MTMTMTMRKRLAGPCAVLVAVLALPIVARAQDVPGIEICTAEKTMERRTSCLQSNVDFLKKAMTKAALDQQARVDAARAEIEALRRQVEALKASVAGLEGKLEQLRLQPPASGGDKKPPEGAKSGASK